MNKICQRCQKPNAILNGHCAACHRYLYSRQQIHTIFLLKMIKERLKENFVYAEVGVYRGESLFSVYELCKSMLKKFTLYAIDSFEGFPDIICEKDKSFKELYKRRWVTKDHYIKANYTFKTRNFSPSLFADCEIFFEKARNKKEIIPIKTTFDKLKYPRKFCDVVFIDCDLYKSVKDAFKFFKDKTKIMILDEYYSLKYPGPCFAINEFLQENKDWKLKKRIEHIPYWERAWLEK